VIDRGKKNVLGVLVDAVDYEAAVARILAAARDARPLAVSALAVHGVMTAVRDDDYRARVNDLDLVTPDGQPVRWALNLLYDAELGDRVYGPTLTTQVLAQAQAEGLPVYFYGSRPEVLEALRRRLIEHFPELSIVGMEPSKFRAATAAEIDEIAARIKATSARMVFVGLGCPRQEVFAHALRDAVGIPALAVGAAFDYEAGLLRKPPEALQRLGLEWAWRLVLEPRRLWRRYLLLNPAFAARLALQKAGLWRPRPSIAPEDAPAVPA
jgi:N-acetylglucosaminyldiphosphoundecaprenol N-acetyl-beta-D-mannosaminyltransferase